MSHDADWKKLSALAMDEIEATLAELPLKLLERARKLAVTFERAPHAGMIADGIAPDTLGLFTGAPFTDELHVPMPPQIILYLGNLWEFSERDEEIFQEEVQKTYLHELGHYLGLDEDDLFDRGLD